VLSENRKEQAKTMDAVAWQGKSIPVKSEKLRVCFIEANEVAAQVRNC
jgi:hypothetical protein